MFAISGGKLALRPAGELRHDSPQQGSTDLQRGFLPCGNGRPEKNTAATAASSTSTDLKYSANNAVFSNFLVVACDTVSGLGEAEHED